MSEAERSDASFSDFVPCPVSSDVPGKLPSPGRGLFLCQDKKRRWGPVGASPHLMADEGQADDGQPSRLAFFTINELQFKIHPIFAVSRDPLFTYINHIRE